MKRTFDTEERIVIENNAVLEDGVEYVINPYDEYAVEEAISLREKHGGEVTIISVGPPETEREIRTALAMGADRALLVETEGEAMDEHSLAHILAAVIKERDFDLILGGNLSVDNGASQVAVRVAELLGLPQVTTITKLDVDGERAVAQRDVEGDVEIVEVKLPALFTAQQGLNDPRYPSLPGIMKAKKKPLERIARELLQLSPDQIRPKTETVTLFSPPVKEKGRILEGELADQVKELVQLLRDEAKVV